MAQGTKDPGYSKNDYSQTFYNDDSYLDPNYLNLAYLDPNVLVTQTGENEFQLQDMTTGDVSIIEREPGGGLRQASSDDQSAFASPTERSLDNEFGYDSFSLGKVGDNIMGALSKTGVFSPTGIMGNTHNAINNINKNMAVEQARKAMELNPKEQTMFSSIGNLKDPRGMVANMQIGEETYSVSIGGVKKDPMGRPTISVQEAMDLAENAKAKGLTVRELSTEEQVARDKLDAKKGITQDPTQKGILSAATEIAKDTAIGVLTGNPTKGITSAANQIAKAAAPTVKDIARSVISNPDAKTKGTVSQAYSTSPAVKGPTPQTPQERAMAPNALGVQSPAGFTSPMGSLGTRTTSPFGQREAPTTGKGTKGSTNHKGMDISTPAREAVADTTNKSYAGAPLSTPGPGTVTSAGYQKGYGYTVDVSHPGGWTSKLSHMAPESITVSVGDQIAAGTPVGQMGTTGNSQAAHAHFEMRDPLGNLIDPASVIDFNKNPTVATPQARPEIGVMQQTPSTTQESLVSFSPDLSIGISQDQTLGGVNPSTPNSVQTSPNAYGMMANLDNMTAPSSMNMSMANQDPTPGMKNFSPSFADVVGANTTVSKSVSPQSMNAMANLSQPDAPSSVSPGRAAHNQYSAQDISKMGFAMAGELSPGSLKGLQANDPEAVREALGMFSTIDNRVQSFVERGVPLSQAVDATLTGTQYNSLMAKNTPTTSANFSQFGQNIKGLLGDVVTGVQNIPADLANVTHYANLSLVDPSWAKTPKAMETQVAVGAHTFSTPDNTFSNSMMSATPDATSTSVSTTSSTAKDTAQSLGMNDTTPGASGLGMTSRDTATNAAVESAKDAYGIDSSRSLGGASTPGSRMGASNETGSQTNSLGGGLSMGGGYVDSGSLGGISPSDTSTSASPSSQTGTESGAGFGGVSGSGSTSRGGTDAGAGKGADSGGSGSSSGSDKSSNDKSDNDKGGKGGKSGRL